MGEKRRWSLLCTLLCVTLVLSWTSGTWSQQLEPFAGQGSYSPPAPITVYISVYLDRLLAVDDKAYTFTCILFVILTWTDRQALTRVQQRTEQCRYGRSTCNHFCNTESNSDCCDGIWLPSISFTNAKYFSEERLIYEVIQIGGADKGINGSMQWIQRLYGTYSTAMDFRRFPFDSQKLKIEMVSQDKNIIFYNSSTGMGTGIFTMSGKGDAVSGWKLKSLTLQVTPSSNSSSKAILRVNNSISNTSSDPLPFLSPNDGRQAGLNPAAAAIVLKVDRAKSFFIINMVIPVSLTVTLSWSVFLINPKELGTRITVAVSLLLALVSLNFVIREQLPSSSYLTCIHWILIFSYVEVAAADIETLYVHYFLRKDSMERSHEARQRRSKADFKPRTVYGTLSAGGLLLSKDPGGLSLATDMLTPRRSASLHRRSTPTSRRGRGEGIHGDDEVEPLLKTEDGEVGQSPDGPQAGNKTISPSGGSGASSLGNPSIETDGETGALAHIELGSSVSEKRVDMAKFKENLRLEIGSAEEEEEMKGRLSGEASDCVDRVRKLIRDHDHEYPSKGVVLATALRRKGRNKSKQGSGALSKANFSDLKALAKKLPKKTMLRRLHSAREKIQEQATEEEVTEGAVVIDRFCLVLFPIVYILVLVYIFDNYRSKTS